MSEPTTPVLEFRDPFEKDFAGSRPRRPAVDYDFGPSPSTQVSRQNSACGSSRSRKTADSDDEPLSTKGRLTSPVGATAAFSSQSSDSDESLSRPRSPSTTQESGIPALTAEATQQIHQALSRDAGQVRPRLTARKSGNVRTVRREVDREASGDTDHSAWTAGRSPQAFEGGKKAEKPDRSRTAPCSRTNSSERIFLAESRKKPTATVTVNAISYKTEERTTKDSENNHGRGKKTQHVPTQSETEASDLVRNHLSHHAIDGPSFSNTPMVFSRSGSESSAAGDAEDYTPHPTKYRGGVLGALLKLQHPLQRGTTANPRLGRASIDSGAESVDSDGHAGTWPPPLHALSESGATTPASHQWYAHERTRGHSLVSTGSTLVGSVPHSRVPSWETSADDFYPCAKQGKPKRPSTSKRFLNAHGLGAFNRRLSVRPRTLEEIRITKHIEQTIQRQRYLQRLCKALMSYGAPTHRLEEYMAMSARCLEIDAQFLYIPGAMVISFDDFNTHTTEVKLVKMRQGLDLGRLRDVHEVYKEVVHDRVGVEEATERLRDIMSRDDTDGLKLRIFLYGVAAVCVGPFAFGSRLIDLPIAFFLGCILGILQLVVAPSSVLYANVTEVIAAVVTSFLARALGSVQNGQLFCFSALAQSSVALILPGYLVLCASLELQSKSMVAGSVRLVYAIIYSLFLGFGMMLGTTLYGVIDANATSATTCQNPLPGYTKFCFVPAFAFCLCIINHAKLKQVPAMIVIAFAGYLVNFFTAQKFPGHTQISSAVGAFAVGLLANLYSRLGPRTSDWIQDVYEMRISPGLRKVRAWALRTQDSPTTPKSIEEGEASGQGVATRVRKAGYTLAAAAMLPAIFVQVPGGLSVNGSLVAGIASANEITRHGLNSTLVINSSTFSGGHGGMNSLVFNVAASVIQIAIGITVGLFLSAVVVYPVGKRRSGLFSF